MKNRKSCILVKRAEQNDEMYHHVIIKGRDLKEKKLHLSDPMLHFRFKQVFDGTVHFVAFLVRPFETTNDVRYNRYVSCDLKFNIFRSHMHYLKKGMT